MTQNAEHNPEKDWFGDKQVTASEKTSLVRGVFDSVADRYDIMNDLMSGGLHRRWKNQFVRMIRPRNGLSYLDVAGGTGDIAFRLKKRAPDSQISICDLNHDMISVGRDRAVDKGWINDFRWITGNAEALPLEDNSVEVYTIAFGLRNVTHIDTALAEAHRVLKPGGRFYCLEFSHVTDPFLAKLYDAYSYKIIPRIGEFVAKDRESYQYLVESIRKFPKPKDLVRRLRNAGFDKADYTSLSMGLVAIHKGFRT